MSGALEGGIERARLLLLETMLEPERWPKALAAVTEACGARTGQLLALDGHNEVAGHYITGSSDTLMDEFEAYEFADPSINPRFRLGLSAPLMTPIADQDYVSRDERRRSAMYADLFDRHDLPFNCQAVLVRDESAFIRTSITRTRKQGPLDRAAFYAFGALLPHLQAVVRMQVQLAARQSAARLQTIDALGAAALLLSERGIVSGVSAAAETLMAAGDALQIVGGRLRLRIQEDQAAFDAVLAQLAEAARAGRTIAPAAIPLSGGPLVLEVQPLARERMCFDGAPATLALIRPAVASERISALRRTHGLTRAEADVALALGDGQTLEAIAERRAVALTTVRSQVQSVYAKMDVHRQAELVAALRRLGVR